MENGWFGGTTISGNPHYEHVSVFFTHGWVCLCSLPFSIINRCRQKSPTLARSIGVSRGNDGPLASLHKVDNIVSSVSFLFRRWKSGGMVFVGICLFLEGGEGICSMTLTNLNFGQVLLAMRRVHHVHHQCFFFWKVTKDMNALVWVDKLTWERQTVMYHRISHQEFLRSPRFKNTLSKGNAESFLLRMPNLK